MNPSNLSAVLHMQLSLDFSSSSKTTLITSFIIHTLNSLLILFSLICSFLSAALFVFLAASAWAWIVRINLLLLCAFSVHGLHCHPCLFQLLLQPLLSPLSAQPYMRNSVRIVSSAIAFVISPNISYPVILYSTSGSLCPYA